MKLCASILHYELRNKIIMWKLAADCNALILSRPEYLGANSAIDKCGVYIARADLLPETADVRQGSCLVCLGQPPWEYLMRDINLLCVSQNTDIFSLFNDLSAVFDKYDAWEAALQDCVNKAGELQEMVCLSYAVFGNPINIVTSDFEIIAMTENSALPSGAQEIPQDVINSFKYEPKFMEFWNSNATVYYQSDLLSYSSLSYIVRSKGHFALGIAVTELKRFREFDAQLLEHMAKYVGLYYEHLLYKNDAIAHSLDLFFVQLLENNSVSERNFYDALSSQGWDARHSYKIYYLHLNELDIQYNMTKYQCRQIEKALPHTIAFEYKGKIVVVSNRTLLEAENDENLHMLLLSSNLRSGASNAFSNIFMLRNYYLQAASAYSLGRSLEPLIWCYNFQDYALEYMLRSSSGELLPASLCPAGFDDMLEYDRQHNTQYEKTLRTYYNFACNTTHAAAALYVHRTTLLTRLKRIEEFLKMDINDARNRLYLMMILNLRQD